MLPPHSVSCSFPSTASLVPVGDVYLPFGLDARLSSGWGWGWPQQGGGNEPGSWTVEGKGGLRESSKLGCPGEMWKRRMQTAHSCSSGGCPCICLSCQGSKCPQIERRLHHQAHSSTCIFLSLYVPNPSTCPFHLHFHPSTPGHRYLLPDASHRLPACTQPAHPPPGRTVSGSCDRGLGSPVSPSLGDMTPSPLLCQRSQPSLG